MMMGRYEDTKESMIVPVNRSRMLGVVGWGVGIPDGLKTEAGV